MHLGLQQSAAAPVALFLPNAEINAVVDDINGSNFRQKGFDTEIRHSRLPAIFGPFFLMRTFVFEQELGARAVHQQVQRLCNGLIGQLRPQCLLAMAHGAEVGNIPAQIRHSHQAQVLVQRQAEKIFDAQTQIREHTLVTSATIGRCVPLHVFVKPDRQRPSGHKCGVARRPVGGLVAWLGIFRFTHVPRRSAQGLCFLKRNPPQVKRHLGANYLFYLAIYFHSLTDVKASGRNLRRLNAYV